MASTSWHVRGNYYETCTCDFICPCLPGLMAARPTKGSCAFAMAFQIERGSYGALSLDGLGFIVLGYTPEAMGKGNWLVGVVVDERAAVAQRDAIVAIASGQEGGPMSGLSGLIGTFVGVDSASIEFQRDGIRWSVKAGGLVDMAAEGAKGLNPNAAAPLALANMGHPAADTFTLARALKSHVHALGMAWDDTSGFNNGQYAPFSWANA